MKRTSVKRRGTMLVEVMTCMVIGMILIGVITTIFVRVVVMDPAAREHLATTTTLGRLAEQFRRDVHAALDATPTAANPLVPQLSLQGPGDLRIEVGVLHGYGRIVVSDQGIGIAPELQARIFEPFFSTDHGTGHGLGLAFCQQVVHAAGGTLRVKSELGRGAIFIIELSPLG